MSDDDETWDADEINKELDDNHDKYGDVAPPP